MKEIFQNLYEMTAFSNIIAEPQFLIMYAIAFLLLYLGIKKQYEPLLLIPIGLVYAAIYYVLFRFVIRRWHLRTPGREDEDVADPAAERSGTSV